MTTASNDYAAAVAALRAQTLPAYVTYTEEAYARGIGRGNEGSTRLTVDTRTNKIIASSDWNAGHNTPPTQHVFEPTCYAPSAERETSWEGRNVIAISLAPPLKTCADTSIVFQTLYVDATAMTPVGAVGTENDDGATVDFTVRYDRFGAYIMPSSLEVHMRGHGALFWMREHARVTYSKYDFSNVRRQSSDKPPR